MELDHRSCDRARRSRDPRFDGRFFIGVTSTRVYCRPICPARAPKDEHVRYFASAAAAGAAGYRPCLRCRPEASPGTPAWLGTSGLVSRALRLIGDGALDEGGVERLADGLGVTARHLRRLFLQHLGATPIDVALTRRVHFAKRLLDETPLAIHRIAFASGFGSIRRFNSQMRRTYARTPTELRRRAHPETVADPECYRFRLAYRPPYDWEAVLGFLRARATVGVESVEAGCYRRTIALEGRHGAIAVSHLEPGLALGLEVRFPEARALLGIVERVRRVFDIGADPAVIGKHLESDRLLRGAHRNHPGIRAPGAWDGFELAVRAILGQQISVRAATTIAGRIASRFGSKVMGVVGLERLFPTPKELVSAPIEEEGVIPARAQTIRLLARHVADGKIAFTPGLAAEGTLAALKALPGIGEWTAEYIAMRALGEPDAFPSGDLVLRRMAGDCTSRELDVLSSAWRPWRAYAVMLLWQGAEDAKASKPKEAKAGEKSHAPAHRRAKPRPDVGRRARRAVSGQARVAQGSGGGTRRSHRGAK